MRYFVYGAGIGSMVAVGWLWVRLVLKWKFDGAIRYVKLAVVIALTMWACWLGSRVNRYRKINNLRDEMAPLIEFAVRHAIAQPGTTPEEKVEMERRIRAGIEEAIEWQVDHE